MKHRRVRITLRHGVAVTYVRMKTRHPRTRIRWGRYRLSELSWGHLETMSSTNEWRSVGSGALCPYHAAGALLEHVRSQWNPELDNENWEASFGVDREGPRFESNRDRFNAVAAGVQMPLGGSIH